MSYKPPPKHFDHFQNNLTKHVKSLSTKVWIFLRFLTIRRKRLSIDIKVAALSLVSVGKVFQFNVKKVKHCMDKGHVTEKKDSQKINSSLISILTAEEESALLLDHHTT